MSSAALDAARRRSKAAALQLEPPGLDLGEVEDVVDDAQQRVAARADDLGELALLGGQLGVEQQAGHADDGVHRRADLVAHRREEGALRLCRRLGLLARAFELAEVARLVDRGRGERREGIGCPGRLGAVGVGLEQSRVSIPVRRSPTSRGTAIQVRIIPSTMGPRTPRSAGRVGDDHRLVPLDQLPGRVLRTAALVAVPSDLSTSG